MKQKIMRFVRDNEGLMNILSVIYRFLMLNRIKGRKGLKIAEGGLPKEDDY